MMKHFFLFFTLLLSAISAEAQPNYVTVVGDTEAAARVGEAIERPRFRDNWSLTVVGGVYHPLFFDLKYLLDCSGYAGNVELRKQLTPIIGIGAEVDGYYRMDRKERRDPRTLAGVAAHLNLMNLFGGYKGRARVFEMEVDLMPAWGHLYRGSQYAIFPDEDYFALKGGLSFNFNLGKNRAWTLSFKPAYVADVTSKAPDPGFVTRPYEAFKLKTCDLQLFAGFAYHFRGKGGKRNFTFATPRANESEVERLNEIVNFLRNDVEARDKQIRELRQDNNSLRQENDILRQENNPQPY